RLQADKDDIRIRDRCEIVGGGWVYVEVAARAQHLDTPFLQCAEVFAPRNERYVGAAASERSADGGADCTGAQHGKPHDAVSVRAAPTRLRWTFRLGVRGISSRT